MFDWSLIFADVRNLRKGKFKQSFDLIDATQRLKGVVSHVINYFVLYLNSTYLF